MPAVPPVDALELARLLGPASAWGPIEVVESTGSTNDDVMRRPDAPSGLVRVAGHQTRGKGRFDRTWQDAPGMAVAVSMVVRPQRPVAQWGWLSLLTGMAVAEALRGLGRRAGAGAARVGLKWPNDVLIDGAKVCGVLSQTDGEMVVLGWGLNVSMSREELPVEGATSLSLAGWPTDKTALVAAVLQETQNYYELWCGGHDMRSWCGGQLATIGRQVRVERVERIDGAVEGHAVGLDETGALLVDVPGVGVTAFEAGDVTHVR